ncbi:hypothetical protein EV421DRAFT_1911561 [Armillaria borealis]|uniref:Uncharacterized protein n=1 Tax=Armillaria borealis TaxID=47425 RepID=A0AA39IWH2_9AGAR|nr:hypothetical protein EV421DRAFT_1911561 [Armillaria borealis]
MLAEHVTSSRAFLLRFVLSFSCLTTTVLLHSTLSKAPAIWDTELSDLLNNHMISDQVQEAHPFLSSVSSYSNWRSWQYGPTLLAEQYQKGVFTLDDAKFLKDKTPPPVPSSSTQRNPKKRKPERSLSAQPNQTFKIGPPPKVEKSQHKHTKCKPSPPSKKKGTEHVTPPPAKASSSKAKAEPTTSNKEGSVATEKLQARGRGCKPAKAPLVKVLTTPWDRGITPAPAVISEDTHVDIWGCSPTPVMCSVTASDKRLVGRNDLQPALNLSQLYTITN